MSWFKSDKPVQQWSSEDQAYVNSNQMHLKTLIQEVIQELDSHHNLFKEVKQLKNTIDKVATSYEFKELRKDYRDLQKHFQSKLNKIKPETINKNIETLNKRIKELENNISYIMHKEDTTPIDTLDRMRTLDQRFQKISDLDKRFDGLQGELNLIKEIAKEADPNLLHHYFVENRGKLDEKKELQALLTPTSHLELDVRSINCLIEKDINTVQELISYTPKELLKVKNFGRKSLNVVIKCLEELNLSLSVDPKKVIRATK